MPDEADVPWWYSGGEQASAGGAGSGEDDPATGEQASADGPSDLLAWMSRAVRMVDWAAGAVVEPHAEHEEPGEHPDCLICRTLVVVADRTGLTAPRPDAPAAAPSPEPAEPIRWIPVRDMRD